MTRNGKIARLPHAVREELNQRIYDGASGKKLVAWLNALSAVEEMLRAEFAGKPLREQSLSEWKKRGYREWLALRQVREIRAMCGDTTPHWSLDQIAAVAGTDLLLVAKTRMAAASSGEERFQIVRQLGIDIDILRRTNQSADRLDLHHHQLAFAEKKLARRKAERATPTPRKQRGRKRTFKEWAESEPEYFAMMVEMIRSSRPGAAEVSAPAPHAGGKAIASSPQTRTTPGKSPAIRLDPTTFLKSGHKDDGAPKTLSQSTSRSGDIPFASGQPRSAIPSRSSHRATAAELRVATQRKTLGREAAPPGSDFSSDERSKVLHVKRERT
jgi:hypothetical protein